MDFTKDTRIENTACAHGALDTDIPISEQEFRLLRDYIHDYCGIYFDDTKASSFRTKLSFRLRLLDITSYSEYYNYLKYNPRSKEEMDDLIPHLTNNETYFFREMNQLDVLLSTVLDDIVKQKRARGEKALRIISCGCSSGEEVFTLAILLYELGFYQRGLEVELTGIDIDRKVLERAAQGEYSSYSLRATDNARIEKYFEKSGDRYRLIKRIRDKVRFVRGNLLEPPVLIGHRGADVVLCRNVLIYFSDDSIRRIAESFYDTLSGGGYLLLGHSESLTRITDIFHARRFPNAILYSKGV